MERRYRLEAHAIARAGQLALSQWTKRDAARAVPWGYRVQAIGAERLGPRGSNHAIAALGLGPARTPRVGRSCLCTGSIRSSRMALLLLVLGGHVDSVDRAARIAGGEQNSRSRGRR